MNKHFVETLYVHITACHSLCRYLVKNQSFECSDDGAREQSGNQGIVQLITIHPIGNCSRLCASSHCGPSSHYFHSMVAQEEQNRVLCLGVKCRSFTVFHCENI